MNAPPDCNCLQWPPGSWNYGLLPQTWEDPAHKNEDAGGVFVSLWLLWPPDDVWTSFHAFPFALAVAQAVLASQYALHTTASVVKHLCSRRQPGAVCEDFAIES